MVGSSQSTASPTFVLNTIVADALSEIADELQKAKDIKAATQNILQRIATEHARVIFNGDNYNDEWTNEAKKRGLPNIHSTVNALYALLDAENVCLFERHNVLSKAELKARTEILLETYSTTINIEAMTMLNIAKRQILPAAVGYSDRLACAVESVTATGLAADTQLGMLKKVCTLIKSLQSNIETLEKAVAKAGKIQDVSKKAEDYRDNVIGAMQSLRASADELETIVNADLWPLPTYAEMLFLK